MATPNNYLSSGLIINFSVAELQILPCTGTSNPGAFALQAGINSLDCMIVNEGPSSAFVVFSPTASPTALNAIGGASGTQTVRVPANETMVVQKGGAYQYFAGICDGAGSAALYLHAGRGS